jgi:hypothetical protein
LDLIFLSTQSLVDNIEKLISKGSFYFFQSRKKTLKFERFATFLDVKALKILCNVKTSGLSMFFLAMRLLVEYKLVIVQMWANPLACDVTKAIIH